MARTVFNVQASVAASFQDEADKILGIQQQLSQAINSDEKDLQEKTQQLAEATKQYLKDRYQEDIDNFKSSLETKTAELEKYSQLWQDLVNKASQASGQLAQNLINRGSQVNPTTTLPSGTVNVGGAGGGGTPPGGGPPTGAPEGNFGWDEIFAGIGRAQGALTGFLGTFASAYLIAYEVRRAIEATFETLKEMVDTGVELNEQFELLRIGTAAILAANDDIVDAQGRTLSGVQAIAGAQQLSANIQDKIVAAAFASGVGIQEFGRAFEVALPFALQMGLNLDQSVDVVKRLTLAARELGLPFERVQYQISEILRGNINARTQLARGIGLSQEDLTRASAQGPQAQVDLITAKTQPFLDASKDLGGTWSFVTARIEDAKDKMLQLATQGGFKEVETFLTEILDKYITIDEKTGEMKFPPELTEELEAASKAGKSFADALIADAPLIVKALEEVVNVVTRIGQGLSLVAAAADAIEHIHLESQVQRDKADTQTAGDEVKRLQAKGPSPELDAALQRQRDAREKLTQDSSDLFLTGEALQANIKAVRDSSTEIETLDKVVDATTAKFEGMGKAASDAAENAKKLGPEGLNPAAGFLESSIPEPVTAVARDKQASLKEELATFSATAEGQVLAIQRQRLAIEQQIYSIQSNANGLTESQRTYVEGLYKVEDSILAVKQAQAKVDGDRKEYEADYGVDKENKLKKLEEDELALEKAKAESDKTVGQATQSNASAQVRELELEYQKQVVEYARQEAAIREQIYALENGAYGVSQLEAAQRVAQLEVEKAIAAQKAAQAKVDEADQARRVANLSPGDQTRANEAYERALKELQGANEGVPQAVIQGRNRVYQAGQAQENVQLTLGNQGGQIDQGKQELEVNKEIYAQELQLQDLKIKRHASDALEIATIKANVQAEEDYLKVLQAQTAEKAAYSTLLLRQKEFEDSLHTYGLNSPENDKAAEALNQSILGYQQAQLGTLQAQTKATIDQSDALDAVKDAWAQNLASAGGLLDVISNINKGLEQLPGILGKSFQSIEDLLQGMEKADKALAALGAQGGGITDFIKGGGIGDLASLFSQGVKAGGGGKLGTATGATAASGGLFDYLSGKAQDNGNDTLSAVLKGAGDVTSGVSGLLATGNAQTGTTVGGIIGGGESGAKTGGAIGSLGGPVGTAIGTAIGGVAGAIIGGILGHAAEKQREDMQKILETATQTMQAIATNVESLSQGITSLQSQRSTAASELTGTNLTDTLTKLDDQITQLKQEQQSLFNSLNQNLQTLQAPQGIQDIASAFANIYTNVQNYINAGANAADVTNYLAASIQNLALTAQNNLNNAELNTISLLQQENLLQQSKADLIRQTNEEIQNIQAGEGIGFLLTPSQQAARQIRDIQISEQEQLTQNTDQQEEAQTQLGIQQQQFNLSSNQYVLEQQKLQVLQEQTVQTQNSIAALQQFLALNSAVIQAAQASTPQNQIPLLGSLPGAGTIPGVTQLQNPYQAQPTQYYPGEALPTIAVSTANLPADSTTGQIQENNPALGVQLDEQRFNNILTQLQNQKLTTSQAVSQLQNLYNLYEGHANSFDPATNAAVQQMLAQVQTLIGVLTTGQVPASFSAASGFAQPSTEAPPDLGGGGVGIATGLQPVSLNGSPTLPTAASIFGTANPGAIGTGVGTAANGATQINVAAINVTFPAGTTPQDFWSVVQQGIQYGVISQGLSRTGSQ